MTMNTKKDPLEELRNRVFQEDVLSVLRKLPDNSVDMVYGDPDYNVGVQYAGYSYKKKWEDYINWYITLAQESLRVLKPTGNLFLINYPKQNAHLRAKYLDENAFSVHEYVWIYNTNIGHSHRHFTTAHRSILHATKTKNNHFFKENVALPYQNPNDKRIKQRIAQGSPGRMPYSWFYFDLVKNVSKDKTFHSCQIPLGLVEILIKAATQEGDDVFILFGGSGSEIILCHKLKRNFISCEIHPEYYRMIQDRIAHEGNILPEHRLKLQKKLHPRIEDPKLL